MVNPLDVFIIDTLVKTTGFRIDPVVCMRTTIFETINKLYGGWESSEVPLQAFVAPAPLPPSAVSLDIPSSIAPGTPAPPPANSASKAAGIQGYAPLETQTPK